MQARDAAISILPRSSSPAPAGLDLHGVRAQRIADRTLRLTQPSATPVESLDSDATTLAPTAILTDTLTPPPSPTPGVDPATGPRLEMLLRERLGPEKLGRYLRGGRAVEITGDAEVLVSVCSPLVAAIVEKDFATVIRAAAAEVLGRAVIALRIRLVPNVLPTGLSDGVLSRVQPGAPRTGGATGSQRVSPLRAAPLGQALRYRMSDVVQGAFNRLAAESARRHSAGESGCGMLVVHAGVGMGKTHLLHALASEAALREPGRTVVITTAEQFVNEFVMACKLKHMDDFRRKFRRADLLCIDDVQSFVGKTATQQELVATLDAVQQRSGRVAFTADAPPRQIAGLSDALSSRLSSGLVVGVSALDGESIGRVIGALATRRGLRLEDEALSVLTHAATTARTPDRPAPSIRDIEGLVTKVEAVHRLLSGSGAGTHAHATGRVGVLSARQALGHDDAGGGQRQEPTRRDGAPRGVQMGDIVRVVCERLSVDAAELANKHRHPRVVLARALCTHLARAVIGMSYPEIARSIGRPNHSTVLTAHQRIQRQIAEGLTVGGIGQPVRQLAEALQSELTPRAMLR